MDNIYQNNLKFLESKNPLMNFKMRHCYGRKPDILGDVLLDAKDEVVFLYRLSSIGSLKPLLGVLKETSLQIIVFETSLEEASYFMQSEEMGYLLQCRGFQWYLLEDVTEELFLKLAWETVFLKTRFVTAFADENFTRFKQKMSGILDAVFLSASEYSDYGIRVLANFYKNLSLVTASTKASQLKCPGTPIVICGAGPSLYHQIDILKELQHKALIFAGGSVVQALIQQGIKPHLVALIDPDSTAHQGLRSQVYEIPTIYQMRLCHEVLRNIHGQKILAGSAEQYPIESYLLEKLGASIASLESGWHVGNFMATVAAEMGCDPIVLIGMDMVYKGDVEYVEGVHLSEEKTKVEAPCLTMQGEKAFSRKDLLMGREFFSDLVLKYPQNHFINATLEGLPISSMEHKPLQEMIGRWPTKDLEGMLHSKLQVLEKIRLSQQQIDSCLEKLKESCEVSESYLKQIFIKLQMNSLHQKGGKRTKGLGQIALEESELEEEILCKNYLEPLWHIWKWIVLRQDQKSVETVEGKIQQSVFYLDVLRKHKVLLE